MTWHYELSGDRFGPVDADKIKSLYRDGRLNGESLVWQGSFGSNWKKISEVYHEFGIEGGPPPLPSKPLTDIWAWLLALSTVFYALIEALLKDHLDRDTSPAVSGIAALIVNCIFVSFDLQSIKQANRNPEGKVLGLWVILVPIYLVMRARAVAQGSYLFFVWLVASAAVIFIQNPTILSGGVYFGSGVPKCDSGTSVSQVNSLFDQIPLVKISGLKLVQADNYNESSFDGTVRTCTATAKVSNNQTYNLRYTIKKEGNQFMFYINIVN